VLTIGFVFHKFLDLYIDDLILSLLEKFFAKGDQHYAFRAFDR